MDELNIYSRMHSQANPNPKRVRDQSNLGEHCIHDEIHNFI